MVTHAPRPDCYEVWREHVATNLICWYSVVANDDLYRSWDRRPLSHAYHYLLHFGPICNQIDINYASKSISVFSVTYGLRGIEVQLQ